VNLRETLFVMIVWALLALAMANMAGVDVVAWLEGVL
jgi:hypothetical protein